MSNSQSTHEESRWIQVISSGPGFRFDAATGEIEDYAERRQEEDWGDYAYPARVDIEGLKKLWPAISSSKYSGGGEISNLLVPGWLEDGSYTHPELQFIADATPWEDKFLEVTNAIVDGVRAYVEYSSGSKIGIWEGVLDGEDAVAKIESLDAIMLAPGIAAPVKPEGLEDYLRSLSELPAPELNF